MNKHIQQLMLYPPKILQSRVDTLRAELDRARESLPAKVLSFVSVLFALFAVGLSCGFTSLAFIVAAFCVAVCVGVISLGAWGLRANLRDSTIALKLLAS